MPLVQYKKPPPIPIPDDSSERLNMLQIPPNSNNLQYNPYLEMAIDLNILPAEEDEEMAIDLNILPDEEDGDFTIDLNIVPVEGDEEALPNLNEQVGVHSIDLNIGACEDNHHRMKVTSLICIITPRK